MSSVQCSGQMLRRPENGRLNCPELTTWIAKPGQKCRLDCDGGYTPSVDRISCFEHGWSIPKMVSTGGTAQVTCVGGGATTMLIIGLLVGGLILICAIAFAYAKFNDKSGNAETDSESGVQKGARGANARKAMDEETINGKIKNYENPNNIYTNQHPNNIYTTEPTMMIPDNNSVCPSYARGNSPDSYASGYPPLMLQGVPPAYDFRPQISPPSMIQNYETFMLPQHMMAPIDPMASMVSMQGYLGAQLGMNPHMTQSIGPTGLPQRSISHSHSMSAYDHVSFPPYKGGLGPKSKSFSPDGYNVPI